MHGMSDGLHALLEHEDFVFLGEFTGQHQDLLARHCPLLLRIACGSEPIASEVRIARTDMLAWRRRGTVQATQRLTSFQRLARHALHRPSACRTRTLSLERPAPRRLRFLLERDA